MTHKDTARKTRLLFLFALALSLVATPLILTAQPIGLDAYKLQQSIHADSSLWDRVAEFADNYPRRLSGTVALEEGIDWIIEQMKIGGLGGTHAEGYGA